MRERENKRGRSEHFETIKDWPFKIKNRNVRSNEGDKKKGEPNKFECHKKGYVPLLSSTHPWILGHIEG